MTKVCHVTSVHEPLDDRIFIKECVTLASNGFQVTLVAPGESFEKDGVKIVGCGERPENRIKRAISFDKIVFGKALAQDADIYHFHDPEMLKYAVKLVRHGKKVVFDSHEDVPAQIMDKPWIPKVFRPAVSSLYERYETRSVKELTAVVVATEFIEEKFRTRCRKTITICNYPKLDDIEFQKKPFSERSEQACYAGGISVIRGEKIMTDAMRPLYGYTLKLAGGCENDEIRSSSHPNVEYVGMLDRKGVNVLYGESRVGLSVLMPTANYVNSLPIKMFEYMAAGLPVIASDFPVWRKVIEQSQCGTLVSPDDIQNITETIKMYIDNPEMAQEEGKRGRASVIEKYNWEVEGSRLLDFYESL